MAYDHQSLEQKWQKFWIENKTYETKNPLTDTHHAKGESEGILSQKSEQTHTSSPVSARGSKPKKYILDMFPYPSGA